MKKIVLHTKPTQALDELYGHLRLPIYQRLLILELHIFTFFNYKFVRINNIIKINKDGERFSDVKIINSLTNLIYQKRFRP